MIVISGSVYVRKPSGYVKCELHKKRIRDQDVFSLKETSTTIKALPKDYSNMILPEIIAKFGHDAIDDDAAAAETSEGT